jgi:uncharacterized protein (DUF305 family)
MTRSSIPAVALFAALAACGTTTEAAPAIQPAPQAAPSAPQAARADTTRRRHSEADAQFMRHMIAHHAQAKVMTALVPQRSTRPDIRLIAERIEVSQDDEIRQMRSWLRSRGEAVPAADEHAGHGEHAGMPGMLSPAEIARLEQARGPAFDRLFLEYMIRHHEGAVTMVQQLLAAPNAAQETDTYRFASDVNADQRAEIARMRTLLATVPRS